MFEKQVLGLREAEAALQAIIKEASKDLERPVAAAIMDDHCETICMMRMDGAIPMFNYMALKKARTAVITRRDTRAWREWLDTRNFQANDLVPDTTPVPGGVFVVKPGEVSPTKVGFGGIGVSGRTSDEDEALAIVGLKALQKSIWGDSSD